MEARPTTPTGENEAGEAAGPVRTLARDRLAPRIAVGVVAAILALLAIRMPVWEARLIAPQYPDGLRLTAYGGRAEGDVREISGLNHYIGMRPFRTEDFPEMALWAPAVLSVVLAIGLSAGFGRRWPGRIARLYVWAMPIGILADVQWRLYQYGHDLDPGSALRVDPFTPLVVGPTKVFNFRVLAWPGLAVILLLLSAALVTFGPRLVGAVVDRAQRS